MTTSSRQSLQRSSMVYLHFHIPKGPDVWIDQSDIVSIVLLTSGLCWGRSTEGWEMLDVNYLLPTIPLLQNLLASQSLLFAQPPTHAPGFISSPSIWHHLKAFPNPFLGFFKRSLCWPHSLQSRFPSVCSLCSSQSPVQPKATPVGQYTASNPKTQLLRKVPLALTELPLLWNLALWGFIDRQVRQTRMGRMDFGETQIAYI